MAAKHSWDELGILDGNQGSNDTASYSGGYDRSKASSDTVFDTQDYNTEDYNPLKTSLDNYNNDSIWQDAPSNSSNNLNATNGYAERFGATPIDDAYFANKNNDSTSTWDKMKNAYWNFEDNAQNYVKSNPITSFLAKAGQSAANVMTNGGALDDSYDTGSNFANSAADFIGTGLGFGMTLPGTNFSTGTAMNKVIGQPVEDLLTNAANKYGVNNTFSNLANSAEDKLYNLAYNTENQLGNYGLSKLASGTGYLLNNVPSYGIQALKTGAEFGGYQGLSNAIQGKDISQGIAEGMGQGMLWGFGNKAVGDAFSHFMPGLGKVKALNDDGTNVTVQDEAGNTHNIDKATFDSTAQKIPQQTIDDINYSNNDLSTYSPRELIATKNYNNDLIGARDTGIENNSDSLGFNPEASNNAINNEIKSRLGKDGGTTYTVKNTAKDQAMQNLQDAMDTIGNYFGTNKLTPEEQARIKPELGIDLEQLINNVDNANTDVRNIGDRQRLRQVAGVNNTTFKPVTETTTEQIPFVRTQRQPTVSEQIPSTMTYREKVPATANEQVPMVRLKKERSIQEQPSQSDVNSQVVADAVKPIQQQENKLSGHQAQLFNIYTSNLRKIAEENNLDLNKFYGATKNINAFNPTSKDANLIISEFEKMFKNNSDTKSSEYIQSLKNIRSQIAADTTTNINSDTHNNMDYKVNDEVMLSHNNKVDAGTIKKINNDGTYEIQRPEGDYILAKKNGDTFESVKSSPTSKEQLPLDDRTSTNVGNRKVMSYQYLHPELKSYIQNDAETLLHDLKNTSKGERGTREDGSTWGTQRSTSPDIAYLRDSYKMSYADIEKGLKKLIQDDGSENNAASKRIELVIDQRLSHGYKDIMENDIEANKDYIASKNSIEGKGETLNTKPSFNNTVDFSGYVDKPHETTKTESTPVWSEYETKEVGKPQDNKVSGYKTVTHENTYGVQQDAKYPKNQKMPVLSNPKKPIEEGQSYSLKNLGDVTVKSIDGNNVVVTHKSGQDIPMTRKVFNDLNRDKTVNESVNIEQGQPQSEAKGDSKPSIAINLKPSENAPKGDTVDFSKIEDVDTLNKHITDLKEAKKNTKDVSQLKSIDLQLFAAQQQLKKLTDIVRPNIEKPRSKIVLNEQKYKFSFKNALNNFYTKIVDINKPMSDMDKVSGGKSHILATNSKNVGGIVDTILQHALVDREGKKIGYSLKQIMNQIPKGKEEQFWEYMLHRHNVQRAEQGKNVFTDYNSAESQNAVNEFERLNPDLKRAGQEVNKFLNKFMDEWGHKSGLISTDLWNSLKKQYPNYVPTNRIFSELEGSFEKTNGKGFVDQTSPLAKAKGSDRDINNPVVNIMNLINRTVRTAKYNEVGQDVLNSVRKNPEGLQKFAEILPENSNVNFNHNNVVTVLENGEKVHMQINNKPLLDALKAINKNDLGDINRNVKKATNLFKALITTKNPLFSLSNISRDVPTYLINSKENNLLKAMGNLGSAFKDIVTNSDAYKQYKGVGGGGSNFFNSENPYKSAKDLTANKNLLKMLDHGIETFNNVLETGPRLAEFKRTLAKTGDINQALFDSNDVTTNFSRGGNYTKAVDAWVPYLNAGVQGLDKLGRQFINKPMPTIAKGLAGVTSLSVLQGIANANNPNYDKLDNRTKDSYYLIPNGDTFIKIPKSREYGVIFGSLFERLYRQYQGDPQAFKDFFKSGDGLSGIAKGTVATNFAPTNPLENNIASPYFNLKSNKDFADRAIVPQLIAGRSPELQYDEKTSEIGKAIGKLGYSPKQVDYIIKSYTGVIGQFVLPMTTTANLKGGSKVDDLLSPITSRYTADPLYNNQSINDFYDNMQKAKTAATDKNFTGNIDPKARTHEEFISSAFTKANKEISDLTKQSFAALQQGDMNKVRDLRQQIIDKAAETNKNMNSDGTDGADATTGELKYNITNQMKYQKGDNYTTIRKQAKQITDSNLSDEEQKQKLQDLVNKTSGMKQGTPPKKKASTPNPYNKSN